MKREDIALAAQVLTSMKSAVSEMEKAVKKNDSDGIAIVKKQLMELQGNLAKLI